MQRITRLFWNGGEGRLRAGWRLAVQLVLNLALALVGLVLLSSWAGPQFADSAWYGLANAAIFFGATLLAVWLAGRFVDRRASAARQVLAGFGFLPRRGAWWADLGAGLAVGSCLPAAAIWLASLAGWVRLELAPATGVPGLPFAAALFLSAVMFACVGLFEELARAYHERNLLEGTYAGWPGRAGSMVAAVAGAALISALMHRGGAAYLLYVFVSASVLGLFYLLTGRMALAAGAHMAYDFTMLTLFGVGAGEGATFATLFRLQQDVLLQPGGDMDLTPAGLALVLGVEAATLLLLLGWVRLREGRIGLQEGLATPTRCEMRRETRG